jgi:hypothetical protein
MLSNLLRLTLCLTCGGLFMAVWSLLSFQLVMDVTGPEAVAAIKSSADLRGSVMFALVWGLVGGAALVACLISYWHFPHLFGASKQGS